MSQGIRLGMIGAGATGKAHAIGAEAVGGFKLVAAADRIPDRLGALVEQFKIPTAVADADQIVTDPTIDAVCICLPTHLHAPIAQAALKAGKHILIEMPPAASVKDARAIAKAAHKSGRVVLYSCVRRFGAAEQSARQAIEKGYAGNIYHARATWLRTRGVPRGTGWYANPDQSGGGALIDLGLPMLDLLSHLIGAKPKSVFATAHSRLTQLPVDEACSALLTFANGASAELSVSWALNQPASQTGTTCRLSGETGAIDVYTPQGPTLHRGFDDHGQSKTVAMKQPKIHGYEALMRHFKECVQGKSQPIAGADAGVELMELAEAVYRSIATGKAVQIG